MVADTPPFAATLPLPSPEATARFAARLGARLCAGDTLLLSGPIGAGKTHFARSLIQSRQAAKGHVEDVPSPTFTLVQTYQAGDLQIWHADLYRLTLPDEVLELGLDDALAEAVCLVEWPDRAPELFDETALWLEFLPVDETGRRLRLHSGNPRWAKRLGDLLEPADG